MRYIWVVLVSGLLSGCVSQLAQPTNGVGVFTSDSTIKACKCGDALPISGHTCSSCEI